MYHVADEADVGASTVSQRSAVQAVQSVVDSHQMHFDRQRLRRDRRVEKSFPGLDVAAVSVSRVEMLKYLREQIASKDYGFNSWQKQQLYGLINLQVYAKTERQYLPLRGYMRHIMYVGSGRVSPESAGCIELGNSRTELGAVGDQLGTSRAELGIVGEAREECKHPFEAYFVKNWDNCRPMWCAFERQNACTLGNNTNNRLESSWKQLKSLWTPSYK
ncbi:unnamed protein product [Phytophthora fragariaefolia]|uniref:Unnamed protein product n=1 Tax=Phytophthora fragariaefolia TaxID=1490495 RepID=A0A9W7CR61_9STRA|nr:unnamed protein product [Phytophthora fragariaefolia]